MPNKGLIAFLSIATFAAGQTEVRVSLDEGLRGEDFKGRLYVFLHDDPRQDPIYYYLHPDQPVFAVDVEHTESDKLWTLDDASDGFPGPLSSLPPGEYAARAVLDINDTERSCVFASGNIYSGKTLITVSEESLILELVLRHRMETLPFEATDRIRLVRLKSELLTSFHGVDSFLEAGVVLPEGFEGDRGRGYPVVFVMPGFGSTHASICRGNAQIKRYGMEGFGHKKIFIFLNHETRWGYHCFADSDNLGPWGTALVEELIPHLEKTYPILAASNGRFLAGQSSGAWGCLLLQLQFPEVFGGVWACSPDPVDFTNFGHQVDLYAEDANIYFTPDGSLRPGTRDGTISSRDFARREAVLGTGEQWGSFEAVFSHQTATGPAPLFDRESGRVFADTVTSWKRFDLRDYCEKHWREIGNTLRGKIHIFVARDDPYFLDEPVARLKQTLDALNADAEIVQFTQGGHDVWCDEIRQSMHEKIDRKSAAVR